MYVQRKRNRQTYRKIDRESERERERDIYIYIYIYTYKQTESDCVSGGLSEEAQPLHRDGELNTPLN